MELIVNGTHFKTHRYLIKQFQKQTCVYSSKPAQASSRSRASSRSHKEVATPTWTQAHPAIQEEVRSVLKDFRFRAFSA
ncbi:hypothetical protein RSAG8_01477, partial [Rhizoctonia solani AG-8 WAC10335]